MQNSTATITAPLSYLTPVHIHTAATIAKEGTQRTIK